MTLFQILLAAYLAAVNILTFSLYALDKRRARRHMWRVRESTLLVLSVLGGSLGALLGMQILHHKTKHNRFYFTVSGSFFVHVFLFAYLFWRFS